MLEILFIYLAYSKLSEIAKERGHSGIAHSVVFVVIYLGTLAVGAIFGPKFGLPAIAGAYLLGIPVAFITYFILKASVSKLALGPDAPIHRQRLAPTGAPITFACVKCGTTLNAFSSQRGRIIQCSSCKKATMVPNEAPTPAPPPSAT